MKYLAKKFGSLFLTLLLVSFLSFFAFSVIPGDAAKSQLGTEATPERIEALQKEMGLDRDAARCNELHLQVLGQNTLLLPHALEVCRGLSREHRLYIVTNAVAAVQRSRLAGSAIAPYITGAFISEEAGASKPSAAYFDYVFSRIDGITRENCLLVGDSLSSDIRGANNYGLPCCWYNPKEAARPEDLRIDYEILDLRQLYDLV